ncbi:MAG: translocation/assembly module TamB [Bacteroidetes bacterium]|nr:translocation/assembly module TamB [Bacteroidota bacterium]
MNKNKSRIRKIIKWGTITASTILVIVSIFVMLLLYSTSFRQFVVSKVLITANNFLLADVTITDLYFNGVNNLIIEDLIIKTGNDTLANVKKIDVKYKLNSLITNNIQIDKLEITNPKIALIHSAIDSIWNYNNIVKPAKDDIETEEIYTESDLQITISQIIINDGHFKYWDEVLDWMPNSHFDWNKMEWAIQNFDAENIIIAPSKNYYSISIANLTTNEIHSNIDIKKFCSEIQLSEKGIYANNSALVLSNYDSLVKNINEAVFNFDAEMTNFNLFGEKDEHDVENALMSLKLHTTDFNCNFIDNFQFIPIKLGEVKELDINAKGTLKSMEVQHLKLNIANTKLEMQDIKLTNLTEPDSLSYQGTIENAVVIPKDVRTFLSDLDLKVLEQFSKTTITQTYFYGTLDSVFTNINVNNSIGNVYGDVAIGFGLPNQEYNIDLTANSVNLQKLLNNVNLASDINFNIKVKGSHFDIDSLNADMKLVFYPSKLNRFNFDTSTIFASYRCKDVITIDNCNITLINRQTNNSTISLKGNVDIADYNNPKTNLELAFSTLNLARIFRDSAMPRTLTGDISILGEGMSISNLVANANVNVEELSFHYKSMFPFSLDIATILNDSDNNKLHLSADNLLGNIFNVDMEGKFSFDDIIYYLQRDVDLINNFIAKETNDTAYNPNNINTLYKNSKHNNIDLDLKVNTAGLGYLYFIDNDVIINNTNTHTNIRYYADSLKSIISIDTINICALEIHFDDDNLQVDSLYVTSFVELNNDADNSVNSFKIAINSNELQQFNDININKLNTILSYNNNKFLFNIAGIFNELLDIKTDGYISLNNSFSLIMDTLIAGIKNYYLWNDEQINITYSDEKINIKDFNLTNDNDERIEISGIIYDNFMDNVILKISNFNTDNIRNKLLIPFNIDDINLNCFVDSIIVTANNSFSDPIIDANVIISDLNYDNYVIGNFDSYIDYRHNNLAAISNINSQRNKNLLSLEVNTFPISLTIDSNFALIDTNTPIDISLKINDLPSQLIEPFIPEIDKLNGNINGDFNITGYLPDKYEYDGDLYFKNLNMRIIPINMQYTATGIINATTNIIYFDSLKINNAQKDNLKGEALLNGKITLNGLNLDSFSIIANAKEFQILSDDTKASMPSLYGKMIISTNEKPLHIFGTINEPNLSGSISVNNAELKMPQVLNNSTVKRDTKFNYINKENIISHNANNDSIFIDATSLQNSFVDLLNIDLNIKINRFTILLELGNIGNIFARVGTKEPNSPITYQKLRTSDEAKIFGSELQILDGSTLQIYKTMSAKGTIAFPTARISHPTLDLSAEYKGKTSGDYPVNYSVFVTIKGTPDKPIIDLNYAINGNIITGDKQQIQADAFNALTRGIVKGYNDINSNLLGESNIQNLIISQYASKALTDIFQTTNIIQSVNMQLDDKDFSTNIFITGAISDFATWTFGSKIDDIASNYNLSLDVPFYFDTKQLNSVLFQFSKTTDVNNSAFNKNAKDFEVSLKFSGKW